MMLVTDHGFAPDDWQGPVLGIDEVFARTDAGGAPLAVDLLPDADPERLRDVLREVAMIRVHFPSFADGRGFTLAARLRRMGFQGRLRAKGHVIADQYTMARRAGFDEVEISDDLARRQPEDQWRARANWRDNDYRAALRA